MIPLWIFLPPASLRGKIKIWLNQTYDLPITLWVLLVVTNKNYGQPFVQYAERREPFLMEALCHPDPEEVRFKKGSRETIMPLF